ncbi:MAG: hypothetical protein QM783_05260 [Phycisphaerales bacterium]
MDTAQNPATHTETDPITALKGAVRTTTHDAKNAIGLMWLHMASLERRLAAMPDAEAKEAIDGLKDETRTIVRLLESMSEQARKA